MNKTDKYDTTALFYTAVNSQMFISGSKRKSSCGKPQEAYCLQHNLSKLLSRGEGGLPMLSWLGVPNSVLPR